MPGKPVYTINMGGLFQAPAGDYLLFEPPDDQFVYIVRDLVLTLQSGTGDLEIYFAVAGLKGPLMNLAGLSETTTHHLELRQRIVFGWSLRFSTTATAASAIATGYQLFNS